MCAGMIDLKKAMTRITELEEELKSTRNGHEEEMMILVEKNDDLTKKLGVFMGDPAPGGDDDDSKDIRSQDYIITDDTDSNPDGSKLSLPRRSPKLDLSLKLSASRDGANV